MVRCLAEQGADKDKATDSGATPLFVAAYEGHFTVVRYLAEQGADKWKAAGGNTPLQAAIANDSAEVVTYLRAATGVEAVIP